MKHTATKIAPSTYHYRGYTIEKKQTTSGVYWSMMEGLDTYIDYGCDSFNTLRECKAQVDCYQDGER